MNEDSLLARVPKVVREEEGQDRSSLSEMVLWVCEKVRLAPQMVLRAYGMVRSVYEMVPRAYEKARLAPQMGHLVYGMVPRDH